MYVLIHVTDMTLDKDTNVMVYEDYSEAKKDMRDDIERTLGPCDVDEDGYRSDCFYRYDGGKEGPHESVKHYGDHLINEWHIYEV